MARILKPDGTEEEIVDPTFKKLQEIVAGHVQFFRPKGGKRMVFNIDGLHTDLPTNKKAMEYLSQFGKLAQKIVGNVVILEKNERKWRK